jgi:hypothetical protein
MWIEMICLMHEATPYGHLLIHGQTPNEAQLASLTGIHIAEIPDLVAELERHGVFSRTREGVIYSRKLVRMASKSVKAQKNGKKGGNPSLRNQTEKEQSLNLRDKGQDKPQKPEGRSQTDKKGVANATPVASGRSLIEQCLDHFNATADTVGWPKVQKLTDPRRAALTQRIKDVGGAIAWREAINRAASSPLLTGQKGNGWRADFDWLCKAANFTKLMEGNYDPSNAPVAQGARANDRAKFSAAFNAALETFPPGASLVDRSKSDPFAQR